MVFSTSNQKCLTFNVFRTFFDKVLGLASYEFNFETFLQSYSSFIWITCDYERHDDVTAKTCAGPCQTSMRKIRNSF